MRKICFFFIGICLCLFVHDAAFAIRGGERIFAGDYPSVLAIGNCSAVLIGEKTLVTAGHCIDNFPTYVPISRNQSFQGRRFRVAKSWAHPNYKKGPGDFDIGFIQTSESIVKILGVQPALIDQQTVPLGEMLTIVGFGKTRANPTSMSNRKHKLSLPLDQYVEDLLILPNLKGKGACFGDSGGGIFRKIDGRDYLVGIMSHISGYCGEEETYSAGTSLEFLPEL